MLNMAKFKLIQNDFLFSDNKNCIGFMYNSTFSLENKCQQLSFIALFGTQPTEHEIYLRSK